MDPLKLDPCSTVRAKNDPGLKVPSISKKFGSNVKHVIFAFKQI